MKNAIHSRSEIPKELVAELNKPKPDVTEMKKSAMPKSPGKVRSGNQDKLSSSLKKSNNETNDYTKTNDNNSKVDESNDINTNTQDKSMIIIT